MPEEKQNDLLQINEDIEFQKKEWSWARLGWVLMLIIALAGLLGLFGQGPLSKSTARAGGIEVEYERFERLLSPAQIEVKLTQQDFQNGEARVQVDRNMLNMYNLQDIVPEPDQSILSGEFITYVFNVGQIRAAAPDHLRPAARPHRPGQRSDWPGKRPARPVCPVCVPVNQEFCLVQ